MIIILFLSIVWPEVMDLDESNELTLQDCFHEKSIEFDYAQAPLIVMFSACEMEFVRSKRENRPFRKIVVTSVVREGSFRHGDGASFDFYFDYNGDSCKVWTDYRDDSLDMRSWFAYTGWIDEFGQGIYQNLSHHLHSDGEEDLWGFDTEGNMITYDEGLALVEERIEKE